MMHLQEWGRGVPVIALHPLALESTAFAGVARELAARGLRTVAADLPGFGRTPAPKAPLSPAVLAEPVVALARDLGRHRGRPFVLGMSLGGRVALEAALVAPELFRGVVGVAAYLPWRSRRWALAYSKILGPALAERIPVERAWPLLKRIAERMEAREGLEHDWLARAGVRCLYYWSCAATRSAFVSATREMAMDPAFGPQGTWTRLRGLAVPAAFLWCGRDALIPRDHAEHVARALPRAQRLELACSGHFVHGLHYRCFERAVAEAVGALVEAEDEPARKRGRAPSSCACLVAREGEAPESVAGLTEPVR